MEFDEEEKIIGKLEMLNISCKKKSAIVGIPRDQRLILKMLLRPEKYGHGLHDYSCSGDNWIVSEELIPRQSPIDIGNNLIKFEPKF